mgnify:FL=1
MEQTNVQKLARVLRVLVLLVLACNLVCLLLVPGIAGLLAQGGPGQLRLWTLGLGQYLSAGTAEGYGVHNVGHMLLFFAGSWQWVWSDASAAAVTLFLWLCGICTAVILWQAKRVLDTILQGNPFQKANARALKRAAVCCWIISGIALIRLVFWLWSEGNLAPLVTYTALFVPAFFMGGLLFLVMSALFRQAAELQEDQDLTI